MNVKDVNKKHLKELSIYQKKVFYELLKDLNSNNSKERTFEADGCVYMSINGTTAIKTKKEYSCVGVTRTNTGVFKTVFDLDYTPVTLSLVTNSEQKIFTSKKLLKNDRLYVFNPTLVNMFSGERFISDGEISYLMIRNPIYVAVVLPITTYNLTYLNNVKE